MNLIMIAFMDASLLARTESAYSLNGSAGDFWENVYFMIIR